MQNATDISKTLADDIPAPSPDRLIAAIEGWLEQERERLPLLIPVAIGAGICIWQLHGWSVWPMLAAICAGTVLAGWSIGVASRSSRVLIAGGLLAALGFGVIAAKSASFGMQPLERPWVGDLAGRIESVEHVSSRGIVRYLLHIGEHETLPAVIRVNVETASATERFVSGTTIRLKARLMPPPGPALPGGYDFARTAWFGGMGATGSALGPVEIVALPTDTGNFWNSARNRLSIRIQKAMGTETGPVGSALLVGTRGGIAEADAEALRNSGMAHLLSVSGLHVTAVVGGSFLLVASLLALSPWFALRARVPLVAAAASAIVAIFYTLLTGAEVPTIRACTAALIVLMALAMGRDALSLRLLAAGATFVLLFWPEALAGPSFQLSFAAVGTIILLHDSEMMRNLTARREEGVLKRFAKLLAALLLTGVAIELVLAPVALFHFHKSGLYGALANIVAIPLTTFLVMPAQLLGLGADAVDMGLGTPFWWVASQGIVAILWIAHKVSASPGAIALLPEMPVWAFGLAVVSGLAIAIFVSKWRWLGLFPLGISLAAIASAPRPDMLLTGDGQHLAVVYGGDRLALLRPGAGEYARSLLSETSAVSGEALALYDMPGTICNTDGCAFTLHRGSRAWRVLALRSSYMIPAMELAAACRRSDIVVSNRRLPWSCKPAWLKADAALLERTGGLAFYLKQRRVDTVAAENAHHPWSSYSPQSLRARAERRAKEKAARENPPLPVISPPKPQ